MTISGPKEFLGVMAKIVSRVETLVKYFNMIHGSLHLGHVSKDGVFIDFGHSFSFGEGKMLTQYIQYRFPKNLQVVALAKAKIHQTDVMVACSLMDIWWFLHSVEEDHTHKSFEQFIQLVIAMKKWIMDCLTDYFHADISIFEYFRESTIVLGGHDREPRVMFGLPPEYSKIEETFPTAYFANKFLPDIFSPRNVRIPGANTY